MTKRIHYCYLLTRSLPEGGCRYYVGIRTAPPGKTPAEDTTYMGSGPWIMRAVEAHPGEFTKSIVEVFETRAEAKALERVLVGLTTANSPWSYNLREGGEDRGLHSEATKAKLRDPQGATTKANRAKAQDPKWLEATEKRNREQAKDPNWLAASTKAARVRNARPEAREKNSAGCRRAWANAPEEQRAARGRAVSEGKRRAKAERERERIRRETALLFLALVAARAA